MTEELKESPSVTINWSEMEKAILTQDNDNVIFEIVALGRTTIPKDVFFDGVERLKELWTTNPNSDLNKQD